MDTILVLTDFSEKAERAAVCALNIAEGTNAKVVLFHFYDSSAAYLQEGLVYDDTQNDEQNEETDLALDKLAIRLRTEFLDSGKLAPVIVCASASGPLNGKLQNIIESYQVSLIIMGDQSEDAMLNRILFGNESHLVIEESTCPVLLVPEHFEYRDLRKILFASELKISEREGLLFLKELASLWKSTIKLLHITDRDPSDPDLTSTLYDFRQSMTNMPGLELDYDLVNGSDITETLSAYVDEENADLIVLVHRKRSRVGQFMHRSVSKAMMNYHQVPLLVLRK